MSVKVEGSSRVSVELVSEKVSQKPEQNPVTALATNTIMKQKEETLYKFTGNKFDVIRTTVGFTVYAFAFGTFAKDHPVIGTVIPVILIITQVAYLYLFINKVKKPNY